MMANCVSSNNSRVVAVVALTIMILELLIAHPYGKVLAMRESSSSSSLSLSSLWRGEESFMSRTVGANATEEPVWPSRFTIDFNETTKVPLVSGSTSGRQFYDFERNAERIDREDGYGDRYCGTVHFHVHTPCTHIAIDGMRYLVFPKLNKCCSCCSFQSGCGPLSPSWLKNATLVSNERYNDDSVLCWSVKGLQTNIFCQYKGERAPLEIKQGSTDDTLYDTLSFDEGQISADTFDLPGQCTNKCGGVCRFL